jgi:mannosyltransferase OCH1-like enzyme
MKIAQPSYPLKSYYNPVVPLVIYQTWHTKTLPRLMHNSIVLLKQNNPRFTHHLFDDTDCREFIKNNFANDVLHAYDSLIPGAYKADLWRYCILYKNGGIYLDIKYRHVNNFKLISITEQEHFVLDADNTGIYNALLVCRQGNEKLLMAIRKIVENVNTKFYGSSCLEPTGPLLLAKFFNSSEKNAFKMHHKFYGHFNNRFIIFNNYFIFKSYKGYLEEHNRFKKQDHYGKLWGERNIYI